MNTIPNLRIDADIESANMPDMKRELRAHPYESRSSEFLGMVYTIARDRAAKPSAFDPWTIEISKIPDTNPIYHGKTITYTRELLDRFPISVDSIAPAFTYAFSPGTWKFTTWPEGGVPFGCVRVRGYDHAVKLAEITIQLLTDLK